MSRCDYCGEPHQHRTANNEYVCDRCVDELDISIKFVDEDGDDDRDYAEGC